MRLKTCTKLDPPVDGRDFSRPLTSNGLSRRQTPLTSNRRRVSQRATGNGSGKKKADDADGDDPCRDLTNLSLIISLSRKQFITTKASLSLSLSLFICLYLFHLPFSMYLFLSLTLSLTHPSTPRCSLTHTIFLFEQIITTKASLSFSLTHRCSLTRQIFLFKHTEEPTQKRSRGFKLQSSKRQEEQIKKSQLSARLGHQVLSTYASFL